MLHGVAFVCFALARSSIWTTEVAQCIDTELIVRACSGTTAARSVAFCTFVTAVLAAVAAIVEARLVVILNVAVSVVIFSRNAVDTALIALVHVCPQSIEEAFCRAG